MAKIFDYSIFSNIKYENGRKNCGDQGGSFYFKKGDPRSDAKLAAIEKWNIGHRAKEAE